MGSLFAGPDGPKPIKPEQMFAADAKYNRYNINTPFGGSTWSGKPGEPGYGVSSFLSPELQSIVDQTFGKASAGAGEVTPRNPYDPVAAYAEYGGPEYQKLQEAIYGQQTSLLDPTYDRWLREFETKMANRGVPVGSELYDDYYNLERQGYDRAYSDAARNAVMAGRGAYESDRDFARTRNIDDYTMREGMLNADREYGLGKYATEYGNLAQLLGLIPGVPAQQFDTQGAFNNFLAQRQARTANKQQGFNNLWGGVTDLLGSGMQAWGLRGA